MALKRIGCIVLAVFAALLVVTGCSAERGERGNQFSNATCDPIYTSVDVAIGDTNLSDGTSLTLQEYLDGNGDQSFLELRGTLAAGRNIEDGVVHTNTNGSVFMGPYPPRDVTTLRVNFNTSQYTGFGSESRINYLTLCMSESVD